MSFLPYLKLLFVYLISNTSYSCLQMLLYTYNIAIHPLSDCHQLPNIKPKYQRIKA